MCFLDPQSGQELELEHIGPKVSNGTWQGEVLVGKTAQLSARLILVRVPEEVIDCPPGTDLQGGQTQGKSTGQSRGLEASEVDHVD